jgi:hypothetical protein
MSDKMGDATKKSAAALEADGIPYLLGGGLGCFAHGGPPSTNDIDLFILPEDADRALEAMDKAGLRTETPPEQWLVKAWDGDILIDLIFGPSGLEMNEEVLARGEVLGLYGMDLQVMALDDILVTKLMALDEHSLDLTQLLLIARALRENIDWESIDRRTASSPYSRPFFALARALELDRTGNVSTDQQRGPDRQQAP